MATEPPVKPVPLITKLPPTKIVPGMLVMTGVPGRGVGDGDGVGVAIGLGVLVGVGVAGGSASRRPGWGTRRGLGWGVGRSRGFSWGARGRWSRSCGWHGFAEVTVNESVNVHGAPAGSQIVVRRRIEPGHALERVIAAGDVADAVGREASCSKFVDVGARLPWALPSSCPISFAMPDQICAAIPGPPAQQATSGVPELSTATKKPGELVLPPPIETSGTTRAVPEGTPVPVCQGALVNCPLEPPPEAPPASFHTCSATWPMSFPEAGL